MAQKLGLVLADFQTQLSVKATIGATTATIQSATDSDGVSLPSGRYFFTLDSGSRKEHISCDLSGTSLSNIKSLSRQGTETTGFAREHKVGASVKHTDFGTILFLALLLRGALAFTSTDILKYDAEPAYINGQHQLVTYDTMKLYADAISLAGASYADNTTQGVTRISVSPAVTIGTATITVASPAVVTSNGHGLIVGDRVRFTTTGALPTGLVVGTVYFVISAGLTANAFELSATAGGSAINTSGTQSGTHTLVRVSGIAVGDNDYRVGPNKYAADAGSNDTYAITLTNAPTAYATGQVFEFKANTVNTGACTLNVNSLGAKSLKMNSGLDPVDGYIKAGQIVQVIYDGTNFQIQSVSGKPSVSQTGEEIYAADAGSNDTYVITLTPAPVAYVNGMTVRFKANTINTGACTINVNGLGAKTIKKNATDDLSDGDINANQINEIVYDGTNFQLVNARILTLKNPLGSFSSGNNYQAATDGFVTFLCTFAGGGSSQTGAYIYSDATATPTTKVYSQVSGIVGAGLTGASGTYPIKKGNYFRVDAASGGYTQTIAVDFIPLSF